MTDRRGFLRGVGAAGFILAAGIPGHSSDVALIFDPEAYVKDVQAAGCSVSVYWPVPRGAATTGQAAPYYVLHGPFGQAFSRRHDQVVGYALERCPDHVAVVVAYFESRHAAG